MNCILFTVMMMKHNLFYILFLLPLSVTAFSQDYEIQVYESKTQPKGITDVEFHSNFTFDGSKKNNSAEMYSNHLFNETIEITHGFTNHFESALYLFSTFGNDNRSGFAGARIRNRLGYAQTEKLPVGLSLSAEFGKQNPRFFGHSYGLEIKSIIDRHFGKIYLCVNPTIEIGWNEKFQSPVTELVPCYTAKFDFTEKFTAGFEYYTSLGTINKIEPFTNQGQTIFPCMDMELAKNLTLNAGLGFRLNQSSDNLVFKFIVGKSF